MLRSKLVDTIDSPGITAILSINETQRLILAKSNGNIEVYSKDGVNYKLFQTYPHILKDLNLNDVLIHEFYYSDPLSTIFVRCSNSLVLLNSTNLHLYDRIIDKRGIKRCWLREVINPITEETVTYLMYTNNETNMIRLLIWEDRLYKKMIEVDLPKHSSEVQSIETGKLGLILTTEKEIYFWKYGTNELAKLSKYVKRKYPHALVPTITELRSQCKKLKFSPDDLLTSQDNRSVISESSKLSHKTSIRNFWGKKSKKYSKNSTRYLFRTSVKDSPLLLNGKSRQMLSLKVDKEEEYPIIEVSDHSQFFNWNAGFPTLKYISSGILLVHNENTIRFVDYENGFVFLQQELPEGIREVIKMASTYFLVWTENDEVQIYHYQVYDADDGLQSDTESLCGELQDSNFYHLWRRVLFYKFFLESEYSVDLCASENKQESLDVCAMKLRDFVVMWLIQIFDSLKTYMTIIYNSKNVSEDIQSYCEVLHEIIVREIFIELTKFWAPPQLVIFKIFPYKISYVAETLTGEDHKCLPPGFDRKQYEIRPDLFRRWCIPFLIETRRHIKNLLSQQQEGVLEENVGIIWECNGRSIKQNLKFFLLDNHSSVDIDLMLRLLDTVLFKSYLYYSPSMVGPFIRVENMCDINTVIKDLEDKRMFQELVDFYYQRKKHEEALEFLVKLADQPTLEEDKRHMLKNIQLLVIEYLKKIPTSATGTLFKYTEWVLTHKLDMSIDEVLSSIFLNYNPITLARDHMEIYRYINKHDNVFSMRYLEFILSSIKTSSSELYTTLIKRYLEEPLNDRIKKKLKYILKTPLYDPIPVLKLLDDSLIEAYENGDRNLIEFLSVLKTYPLFKLEEHHKAVDILFGELHDYRKSSDYCIKVINKQVVKDVEILVYFFKKILDNYNTGNLPDKERLLILKFLDEHGLKLNAADMITQLPKDMAIKEFGNILSRSLIDSSLRQNNVSLKRNLLQVELIKITNELNIESSHYIRLSDNGTCYVCNKHFTTLTTDSALWFTLPNNKDCLVHYGCGKALQTKLNIINSKSTSATIKTVNEMKKLNLDGSQHSNI